MENIPNSIRGLRKELDLTQRQLADRLGVTYVTVSRWESGLVRPNRLALNALAQLSSSAPVQVSAKSTGNLSIREALPRYSAETTPDFLADPEAVRLYVEGQRLRLGHLFSKGFATETALVDPVPHQWIAVYQHMLPQPRLRFLLADDAGAGKTIMTGLYVREMLYRRLIGRVLIVSPAGLVGNWKREMTRLFSLDLREITGPDCRNDNPFAGSGSDLAIISLDTLTGEKVHERLSDPATAPYDLVVFDEAHKLSASRNADLTFESTTRYKTAEMLAGADALQETRPSQHLSWHAHHLLLLTATPHMGKDFPYYALWRLLEPSVLPTMEAFGQFPAEARAAHYLRRTKEEMIRYDGSRIYPTRESNTIGYDLTQPEWDLYEAATSYIRQYYNKARTLNRSAARLAMSVLQRRAASSTYALLRSLRRRVERLDGYINDLMAGRLTVAELQRKQRSLSVQDEENTTTADEEAGEQQEAAEDEAMAATAAQTMAELQVEKEWVVNLVAQAEAVYDSPTEDSKFEKLRETIQDERFKDEKLLIFTEHRDTLDFLVHKLEALGYTGDIAHIDGTMPYQERDIQEQEFKGHARIMVATDAAGEGRNMQFCWVMINYDIPWNPARIEQRFGRIHRYGQKHEPVVLMNLVANKTREGRVLKTLLTKLELIRNELGSDKVFDVIGRQFEGVSLGEIIMRAVEAGDATEATATIERLVSKESVNATVEANKQLLPPTGDVADQLPALAANMEQDQISRLLPGFVRRFIEMSAPMLGASVVGDPSGDFKLQNLPLPLAWALEQTIEDRQLPLSTNRPSGDNTVLFLRPGEPFFDRYRAYFCDMVAEQACQGAAFVDPYATKPYLYHLALVTAVRRAGEEMLPAFPNDQSLETRLVGVQQNLDGKVTECPVEQLMVLQPLTPVSPLALPSQVTIGNCLEKATAFLRDEVAEPLAGQHRELMQQSIPARADFLRKAFDYQEAELLESRRKLREKADTGDAAARRALESVRAKQRALAERRDQALTVLRREPELVEVGEVTMLAHALALPSSDPEDKLRHDREIELIAVRVAWAYEEQNGGVLEDVSDPRRASGFDLLSRRPGGEMRCIEVKGRRAVGDVQLNENEWAKAANLREKYWLYVVYDCATAHPRLWRVQDPFQKLLVKARGGVIIDERQIIAVAAPG